MAKTNENVKVKLSDEELLAHGRDMARLGQQLSGVEDEEREAKADYKARKERLNTQINHHRSLINNGYEFRRIECEVLFNTPEPGYKTVIRPDTGEQLRVESMTAAETQSVLDFEAENEEPNQESSDADSDIDSNVVEGEVMNDLPATLPMRELMAATSGD